MREGMKVLLAGILMGVVLLTGCGRDTKLPESFDEETVRQESEKAMEYFNDRDYQSIIEMGNDELKAGMTKKDFADQCDPYLDKRGDFEKIEKTVVMGNVDKKTGKEYGGVVMICKYKEGKIQFTIGFDEEMKLVQFLIK